MSKKDLDMTFIDLKNTYARVPRCPLVAIEKEKIESCQKIKCHKGYVMLGIIPHVNFINLPSS